MTLAHLVQHAPRNAGIAELGDEDGLIQVLRNSPPVSEDRRQETARFVAKIMKQAKSSNLRNAAAILLTDLLGKSAAVDILDVLKRPDVAGSSGSLLFALNEAGASLPLDTAVDLIERGSLEAQGEALTFMEEARIAPFTPAELDGARERLMSLQTASGDPNVPDAARLALEFLDGLPPG